MSRTAHCSLCSTTLQCRCSTADHPHEKYCERLSGLCSDCWEAEIDRIPDGPEPDVYADCVKELTLAEIDALVINYAHMMPWLAPAQAPLREAVPG